MNFVKILKSFKISYSYLWFAPLALCLIFAGFTASAASKNKEFDTSIVVFSPTSMSHVMHELMKIFANNNNISVSGTFEAGSELSNYIEEGEPVNIFITEDNIQMRDLQRMGVLNVFSLVSVASDELVVVAPKGNYVKRKLDKIESVDDKMRFLAKSVSMAIPDPDTEQAGRSAKQAFEKLGEWPKVAARMLRTASTGNSLYLAANGDNPGIVYKSDASKNDKVEILLTLPHDYYDKIIYQASIVAGFDSEDTNKDSERFIDFLKSQQAKDIFTKYGFNGV